MDGDVLKIYVARRDTCDLVTEDDGILERFVTHNQARPNVSFVAAPQDADVIVLFEHFSYKVLSHRDRLTSTPLLQQFGPRVFSVNYDDSVLGFLPGCYTSLTPRNHDPRLHRACAYPKVYNARILSAAPAYTHAKRHLFTFRGTLRSHAVRRRLHRVLSQCPDGVITEVDQPFHSHTENQKDTFVQDVMESHFVLCPRGESPSTYRLFEVMALGGCPVIISDNWIPVPNVAWQDCSIRVRERDVDRIPAILAKLAQRSLDLGQRARQEWEKHFSESGLNHAYLDQICALRRSSDPMADLSLPAQIHRWHSLAFRWNNGWTLPQRAFRRLRSALTRRPCR